MRQIMVFPAVVAVFLAVSDCNAAPAAGPLAIEHVTVLPMTVDGEPMPDATVIVTNGRIEWLGPSSGAKRPRGAMRINGRGKFLMPGFTDMHMHLLNDRLVRLWSGNRELADGSMNLDDMLLPYLANGITQVFNLTAMSETIGQRVDIESGRSLGPHIATAALIDGNPPLLPAGISRSAATPEDGRQAVRDASAEGYEFIKAYSKLSVETFTAVVDEARKLDMRVVGHIPQRERNLTEQFFQPGFDLVAHAEEFAQHTNPPAIDAIPRYVEMARRNGTWLTATLTLDERILEQMRHPESLAARRDLLHLSPGEYRVVLHENQYLKDVNEDRIAYLQRIVDFNRELVRAFVVAGIPVLTGTDAPVPGVAPGFSLHDEFQALARAGMSHQQVLEGTTRQPAEWLGTIGDRGTVERGKRADLVLLDADPTVDIANTRRIAGVVLGGRYLDRAELDRRMRVLADRNRAD